MNRKLQLLCTSIFLFFSIAPTQLNGQSKLDSLMPLRGFCIQAPTPKAVDEFVKFIEEELAPRNVNALILRVEYNYAFMSHPELRDSITLSLADVKKLVAVCKKNKIRIIPQINLLGHQSWANKETKLLQVYPQFDETPHIKMPEKYVWPNPDGLYCKSYCPLHPDVHKVVFALVDEICDVFEATAFHAGLDEVFYLGDDKCKRCQGRDKAELFANEVRKIRDNLAKNGRELWIWGDRLLDGKTTGYGLWEASYNNTHRAIDLIPKDILICDWHYERPDKSAVYFAMKGFKVATSPWRNPELAVIQTTDMLNFRKDATAEMRDRFQGMVQTVWQSAESFMQGFYSKNPTDNPNDKTAWNCFRAMFTKINDAK